MFSNLISIRQEKKAGFNNFKDFYEFLTNLTTDDENRKNKTFPCMLPFDMSRCADHYAH